MKNRITRRQAVLGVSSTLVLPACSQNALKPDGVPRFLHGVASGDPDTDSLVIWTRVSGLSGPVDVDWYIATDPALRDIVAHGQFSTSEARDYTVKPVVAGLQPGSRYYYQFVIDGTVSPVGRTRTLPVGHLDRLVLAVATCSNFPFGWFNAYEVIAADDTIDMVVHLGDYIYEYRALGGYGAETGRRIGRMHEPGTETITLQDYRMRHAQYKTDPGSVAMHSRHPIVVIWDDHESANNPWMEGAENHQVSEGSWTSRRAASLKAYYEWMPIRDPGPGGSRMQYWRHFKFGDLASLITLESRHTGRSEQLSWSGRLDDFESREAAQAYYAEVVGAQGRNMLSAEQDKFLSAAFAESVAAQRRWRIIGNQSVMARRVMPDIDAPFFRELHDSLGTRLRGSLDTMQRLGELGLPFDLDAWDGYPDARERFYDLARNAGVQDLLVISGDSHSYWANALYDRRDQPMGVELGSTGITSPSSLLELGEPAVERLDQLFAETNKEVVWVEGRYRGFIRLDITHDGAHADFVTVTNVESRDYEKRIVQALDIEQADGTLRYARA